MTPLKGPKDTARLTADEVADLLASSPPSPRPVPVPTPVSAVVSPRIEAAHAAVSAFDREFQDAPSLVAKLEVIRLQVRSLIVAFEMLKSTLTYEDDKAKAGLDALEERLSGLARDVADLQREFAEHRTALVATAGRQVETYEMAREALDDAAESEQRISQLSEAVAEAQSDLKDVEAEVVVLVSDARPKLDSVRDLEEQVARASEQASGAAVLAMEARRQGQETASEVTFLKGTHWALKTLALLGLAILFDLVQLYLLRWLSGR